MSQAVLDPIVEQKTSTESGKVSHIVKNRESVTEAYILGTPLEALCGFVWVPSRDPKRYPVCEACKEAAVKLGITDGAWNR